MNVKFCIKIRQNILENEENNLPVLIVGVIQKRAQEACVEKIEIDNPPPWVQAVENVFARSIQPVEHLRGPGLPRLVD